MSGKEDRKRARREAARREAQRRRDERRSSFPLSLNQVEHLLSYLAKGVLADGQQGDLALLRRWAEEQGIDVRPLIGFLSTQGWSSDWDVLLELEPGSIFSEAPTSWMPLSEEELEQLLDAVDEGVRRDGCNHDTRFTQAWLRANDHDVASVVFALLRRGGGCDCEVVLNVSLDA